MNKQIFINIFNYVCRNLKIMKKLFFIITICTLFSCSKDTSTLTTINTSGTIKYKVNGVQVQINNSNTTSFPASLVNGVHYNSPALKGYVFTATYAISPATINEKTKSVIISVNLDSMITGTKYSLPTTKMKISFLENNYYYFADLDSRNTNFSITITSYQNALISGIFSGTFEKVDNTGIGSGFSDITGDFSNIQMTY